MPERSSPAQPNYLRFVSTPTIDIEPEFNLQHIEKAKRGGKFPLGLGI